MTTFGPGQIVAISDNCQNLCLDLKLNCKIVAISDFCHKVIVTISVFYCKFCNENGATCRQNCIEGRQGLSVRNMSSSRRINQGANCRNNVALSAASAGGVIGIKLGVRVNRGI